MPSDETRKAFTRKRARENTVRSWYQNVKRLMSCTLAEPPAFKGKTITERAGRRSSMQVSPPTQTLVVHPGIASRSSSFRPILGRRQYDCTCHTKRQGSAPAKRLCLQYFAILLLSTLGRTPWGECRLETVTRPICRLSNQRACSHTWWDISARQVWIANEAGGLFAGALGVF